MMRGEYVFRYLSNKGFFGLIFESKNESFLLKYVSQKNKIDFFTAQQIIRTTFVHLYRLLAANY